MINEKQKAEAERARLRKSAEWLFVSGIAAITAAVGFYDARAGVLILGVALALIGWKGMKAHAD